MGENKPGRPRARKKPRRGAKYKDVHFKLTVGQKKALESYCRTNQCTPVRFMKSLINSHVERYRDDPAPMSYVTRNQLKLFDPE